MHGCSNKRTGPSKKKPRSEAGKYCSLSSYWNGYRVSCFITVLASKEKSKTGSGSGHTLLLCKSKVHTHDRCSPYTARTDICISFEIWYGYFTFWTNRLRLPKALGTRMNRDDPNRQRTGRSTGRKVSCKTYLLEWNLVVNLLKLTINRLELKPHTAKSRQTEGGAKEIERTSSRKQRGHLLL